MKNTCPSSANNCHESFSENLSQLNEIAEKMLALMREQDPRLTILSSMHVIEILKEKILSDYLA